jgi:cephalosporin-C deacetylase-like acetyl esterase
VHKLHLFAFLLVSVSALAQPAPLTIPSVTAALTVDGELNDAAWVEARVLALTSSEFGVPFPAGGESRIATRGAYLIVNARIPEPGRLVARSTGRNPEWWPEDLVDWTFHIRDAASGRSLNVSLAVNPLGAWRLQNAGTGQLLDGADGVIAAARRDATAWTVEAAIPLARIAEMGLVQVERTRAARPAAPRLRWHWPAANVRSPYQLAERNKEPAPRLAVEQPRDDAASETARSPARRPSADLSWIPAKVWTPEQHARLAVSDMLETSLRARMAAIAEQEKLAWQKVDSRESWERFRGQRLTALRKSLEPFPERTPLRPVVTRRANYGDGFVIENIVFESRPHLLVSANLYLPETPSGKIPAIVIAHAHHAPKTQSELQDLGMTWARSGTAVLVMDQLCAGERSQSQPWNRESYYGRYALGNQLLLAGESLMKWMVWDLMRGIDLLLERPYIDPQRLVMLGAVAGGGDPAAVTAALDPRIAAVIPFNFGEAGPEEHYTEGPRGYDSDTAWPGWGYWETTRNMPRSSVDQFFPWMICASMAPRPFLYSFEIDWPRSVEHEPMWSRYKKVFGFYNARDKLDEVHGFGPFPGPGEVTNVGTLLRKSIDPILNRWLQIPVPAAEYHNTRADAELMALTPAVAAERQPKAASAIAFEAAGHRLQAARSEFSSLDPEARRTRLQAALREKLGDIEPLANPSAERVWIKENARIAVEGLAIEAGPGITLPVLILKPAAPAASRAAVVLAIAQSGKERFLADRGEELMSLLRHGVAVCLADLRGLGELARTQERGPRAMGPAATEFMLGNTLLGARLKDARTILNYLASRADLDPERMAVWGESFAGTNPESFEFDQSPMQVPGPFAQIQAEPMGALVALLTGLYDDRIASIAARGGLVSFLNVLEDRFCHVPQDVIVPGILDAGDVPDILAAQTSRAILIERFVDGRNKAVGNERLRSGFGAPANSLPGLILRETPADPSLADWLARRLGRN